MYLSKYAPISGVVEEVNEALNDQPSLLNKSPEGDGACIFCSICNIQVLTGVFQVGCAKSRLPTLQR